MLAMFLFLNLGGGEITIVMLVILLFFGSNKIPELARGLGRGLREFKDATNNIQREIEQTANNVKKDVNDNIKLDQLTEDEKPKNTNPQ